MTGAGGSIGSEFVVRLARFNPERIILLGYGEIQYPFIMDPYIQGIDYVPVDREYSGL